MMTDTSDCNYLSPQSYSHLEAQTYYPSCCPVEQYPFSTGKSQAADNRFIGCPCRKWKRRRFNMGEGFRFARDEGCIHHMILCICTLRIVQKICHIKDFITRSECRDAGTNNINHS